MDGNVEELDMLNRDPNALNNGGRTLFHDVIGEPEGAHSSDCVWRNSYKCYYTGKNCCYTVLTTICAIPLAFCWGCQFACTTFTHIWYLTPCFVLFNMNFSFFARVFRTIIHCCCDPCYESLALVFTKIYIHTIANGEGYKPMKVEEMNMIQNQV